MSVGRSKLIPFSVLGEKDLYGYGRCVGLVTVYRKAFFSDSFYFLGEVG